MKRFLKMLLIYPLIVTWENTYWVPVQCKEGQQPETYAAACLSQAKQQNSRMFTEKEDFEKWMAGLNKSETRFAVSNVKVYEYDDKRTPMPKVAEEPAASPVKPVKQSKKK